MEKNPNNGSADNYQQPPPTKNGQNPWFVQNGVLMKKARATRHLRLKPLGWSVDTHVISWAIEVGLEKISIEDLDSATTYSADIESFTNSDQTVALPDKGYGEQLCLLLRYWVVE